LSFLNLGAECFSSVLSETRSSTSTTATLKDFVLGQLQSCGARIQISPSAVNEVGQTHIFTVHVDKRSGGTFTPIAGVHPTVSLMTTGGASVTGTVVDNCATTGTNANGDCTVSFTSPSAGVVTGHASATVTVDTSTVTVETDGQGGNSPDAVKRFVDGRI